MDHGIFNRRTALAVLAFAAAGGARAQPTDPVRALIEAMARRDAAAIRVVFAPDASQTYGNGAWKTPDAFLRWLESDIVAAGGRVDNPRFTSEGDAIVVRGEYRNDKGYRSPANFRFEIAKGKIKRWQMRY